MEKFGIGPSGICLEIVFFGISQLFSHIEYKKSKLDVRKRAAAESSLRQESSSPKFCRHETACVNIIGVICPPQKCPGKIRRLRSAALCPGARSE